MHANQDTRLAALLLIWLGIATGTSVCPVEQRWDADTGSCVPCPDEPADKTDVLAVIHYSENCKKYPVCCSSTSDGYTSIPTSPSQLITGPVKASLGHIASGNRSNNSYGSGSFEDKSDGKSSDGSALSKIIIIIIIIASVAIVAAIVIPVVIYRKKRSKKYNPVSSDSEKGATKKAGVNSATRKMNSAAARNGHEYDEIYSNLSHSSQGNSAEASAPSPTVTSQPDRGISRETYYQLNGRRYAGLQ